MEGPNNENVIPLVYIKADNYVGQCVHKYLPNSTIL